MFASHIKDEGGPLSDQPPGIGPIRMSRLRGSRAFHGIGPTAEFPYTWRSQSADPSNIAMDEGDCDDDTSVT